jgi:methyl-accepting chemotaxis protein
MGNFLSRLQPRSIQFKIGFWSGFWLVLMAAVIIAYAAFSLRKEAINTAKQQAVAVAEENAVSVNEEIEVSLNTGRTLAQVLAKTRDATTPLDLDREQANLILKQVLVSNPQLVGVYTIWEADAFDGRDARFRGVAPYDESGRFALYWKRGKQGAAQLEAPADYEVESSENYYQCARQTRLECVTNPYTSPLHEDALITSLVVPIIVNGQFYGVAGVDIKIDFFQRLADRVDIYDQTGVLVIITHNGTIAAATGQPELVGSYAVTLHADFETDNELERIQRGEQYIDFHKNGDLEVYVPISFWRTLTPWSVSIIVPGEKITTEANKLMWQMIALGTILTFAALFMVWVVARQVAIPVRKVSEGAKAVAAGNLEQTVEVATRDETRVLADSFNQMVANLRQMIENDRKANEELARQNAEQQRLLELVATLETPVIPLVDGLLLAPIVGTLDSRRAQALRERLLNEVYEHHARRVILDITGVVTIDTQVAHALLDMARAVRLLGCSMTITGISAAIAMTITQLGISMGEVESANSLQEALRRFQKTQKNTPDATMW